METKKDRLKKLIAESNAMVVRMNEVVKNIKHGDTSKVVLTSTPFTSKQNKTAVIK